MTDHPDKQCGETPLLDLLSYVPADARMIYNHGPTHSQSIPVGVLCQRSVAEITRLRAEAEALRKDKTRLDWLITHEAWIGWNREGDMCSVWKRSDDEDDYRPEPVCGWHRKFDDARSAIDAAIAATKEQQA